MSWARVGRLLRDDGPLGRSLAAVVLVVAWVATWRPQVDPDAWWHLAIGDGITMTGRIPATEPFSWLTAGDRFVAHSWLWDVLLAASWRAAGATGTSLLVLPVTALVLWLVWSLLGLASSAPAPAPLGRAAAVLLAVVVALPLWAPRAQTLDVALVLGTILALARYLRVGTRTSLLALPVIGLLWANLHGSAILALPACVAIAIVSLPIRARLGIRPPRAIGPLALAGVAGLAATVVNPYGPGLLLYPFDREVASAFTPAIIEWRSPDFGTLDMLPFGLLVAGLVLVTVVAVWRRDRSRDPFLLLVAAAWTLAALGSVRFVAIAAPLLVVAVVPGIGAVVGRWASTRTHEPLASRGHDPEADPRPALGIAAVAIVAVLAVGWLIIDPPRQTASIEARQPVAAVAAFDAAGCTARLLPSYGWAGYVVWFGGRTVGAYGNSAEAAVTAQADLEALAIEPGAWLDDHEIGAVLMPADGALSRWLDVTPGWRLAYRDPQATIHVRTDADDCPLSAPP